MRALFIVAIASLTMGFGRTDDLENARFRAFNGLTVAQFTEQTLRFPNNYYDDSKGRNFVVTDGFCTAVLRTKHVGQTKGPEGWRIQGISRRGNCGAF